MASAPSRLGQFVVERWLSDDVLVEGLRKCGLVSDSALDDDLRSVFGIAREEYLAITDNREYYSPHERLTRLLAAFLTGKGRAWAVPLESLKLPADDPL